MNRPYQTAHQKIQPPLKYLAKDNITTCDNRVVYVIIIIIIIIIIIVTRVSVGQ